MPSGILRSSHVWNHFIRVINDLHTNSYCSLLEPLVMQRPHHLLDHQLLRSDLASDHGIILVRVPVHPEPLMNNIDECALIVYGAISAVVAFCRCFRLSVFWLVLVWYMSCHHLV